MKSFKSSKCLLVVFASCFTYSKCYAQYLGLSEGANCEGGVCKQLKNCASAEQGLKNNIRPTICSVKGSTAIVCCPESAGGTNVKPAPVVKTSAASEKCREYSELIYKTIYDPILFESSVTKIKDCIDVKTLIVGGTKAELKEFPHMALIGTGETPGKWICGGSLISNRWILSAAHCQKGNPSWVRLGDLNYLTDDDEATPVDYQIIDRKYHPKYQTPSRYNDIALFKLDKDVQFSSFIRPLCLNVDPITTTKTVASGWGNVESGAWPSEHLLKVTLDILPSYQCNRTYSTASDRKHLPQGIVENSQMCAGVLKGGKDTCQGDSGGPIQIPNPKYECMYTQVGITSFGRMCGTPNTPAIYTRVSNYIPWIEQIVWPKK